MLDSERHGLLDEACGICAYISSGAPHHGMLTRVLDGLESLQHRGQEASGVVRKNALNIIDCIKSSGLVRELKQRVQQEWGEQGECADHVLAHTRYRTSGVADLSAAQPLVLHTRFGTLALAHNGHIVNAEALFAELEQLEYFEHELPRVDSALLLYLIHYTQGDDFHEVLSACLNRLGGAFSMVLFSEHFGEFALRDAHGVRPLVYGQDVAHQGWVIASESVALESFHVTGFKEVPVGSWVRFVRGEQPQTTVWNRDENRSAQRCLFELVYFSHQSSTVFDRQVEQVRKAMGRELYRERPISDVDMVLAVPFSSCPAAVGYAQAARLPYIEAIVRRQDHRRSFIEPTQEERRDVVRQKFQVHGELVRGKRVVVIDDSLVRGTTAHGVVRLLKEAGCHDVHLRIASPAVVSPCYYGIDTPDIEDLAAARADLMQLQQSIGVASLAYLSLEGLYRAVQGHDFCDACFTGQYNLPTS